MSKRDSEGRRPGNGPPKFGRALGQPHAHKRRRKAAKQAHKRWRDELAERWAAFGGEE